MKSFILSLIIVLSAPSLFAQNKFDFDYNINSKAFNTERKFYVHVPEDYYNNQSDSLGVIFILDSQSSAFYNNAKGIIEYLGWGYQIPKMIVVGVHSENRHKEFIPLDKSKDEADPDNIGQAEKLRMHLKDEIFPILQKEFRTNKFKAVIGHSRAGAFIANTVFSDNHDLFNAYIAISPGMHYLNRQILDEAQSMIQEKAKFNNFYYCTYGTVGSLEAYFDPQVNYLDSLFTAHPNNTMHWRKKEMTGKTHWGVVAPSIVDGLIEMNRAYQIDQFLIEEFAKKESMTLKEQIDNYSEQQARKLNYSIPPNAADFRYYANEMTEVGMYNRALELFDLSLSIDENQTRTHYGKAGALIALKDYVAANQVYETVAKILELNNAKLGEEQLVKEKDRLQRQIENLKAMQK